MTPVHGQQSSGAWRYIFAVLLILVAQLATVVHASEHQFHEHTEACDVFQHAQNQLGHGQPGADLFVLDPVRHVFNSQPLADSPVSTVAEHYHQRAPPRS